MLDDTANYTRLRPAGIPVPEEQRGVWTDVHPLDPLSRSFLHEARVRKARWETATPTARALVLGAVRASTAISKTVYHLAAEPFLRIVVRDFEHSRSDANGFQRQFERFMFLAVANDVVPGVEDVLVEARNELQHIDADDDAWIAKAQARVQAVVQPRAERSAEYSDMRDELMLLRGRTSTANIATRIVARTSGLSEDDVRAGTRRFRPNSE